MMCPRCDEPGRRVVSNGLCARCPVIADCLDFALTHAVTGVWGGTTDRMRRRLRQVAS